MNKINFIILIFIFSFSSAFGQKKNIVNAALAYKTAKKSQGEEVKSNLIDAKTYIDEAYNNESTSNLPKMWNYRAKIYLEIAIKHQELDEDAIFKATEAYIQCIQRDKKGRVVVRKWTPEEELQESLTNCGVKLLNTGVKLYKDKKYKGALKYFKPIHQIIALEKESLVKRDITSETITYYEALTLIKLEENEKAKLLLQALIVSIYDEIKIYQLLSKIYKEEGNNEESIKFMSLGRERFPNNESLIIEEINLYIELNKTEELITKLTNAITTDQDNEKLFLIRGQMYSKLEDFKNAAEDFKVVLTLDSMNFLANYMLGIIIFNDATNTINKANETSDDRRHKKLKQKAENLYLASLPYIEKAANIDPTNKENLDALKELYYRIGEYKKSEKIKKQIAELNKKPKKVQKGILD